MDSAAIKRSILDLLDERIDERDLRHLIRATIAFAEVTLRRVYWRHMISYRRAGYTPESLAARCIEDLFLPNRGRRCFELCLYFERIETLRTLDDAEVVVALRKLVTNKVHQSLFDLAGEVDPEYKKILRNIMDAIRASDEFYLREHLADRLICARSIGDAALSNAEMPVDELLVIFAATTSRDDSAALMLRQLFVILSEQATYRRCIALSSCAALFKEFFRIEFKHVFRESDEAEAGLPGIDRRSLIEETISFTRRSLLDRYESRGVYDRHATALIEAALHQMIGDWLDGELAPLYHYYAEHFPHVTHDEYRRTERTRFEYIAHTAKEYLGSKLRSEL